MPEYPNTRRYGGLIPPQYDPNQPFVDEWMAKSLPGQGIEYLLQMLGVDPSAGLTPPPPAPIDYSQPWAEPYPVEPAPPPEDPTAAFPPVTGDPGPAIDPGLIPQQGGDDSGMNDLFRILGMFLGGNIVPASIGMF